MIRFIFLLILLSACNPLQPAKLTPPEAPTNYSVAPGSTQITINERWWTEFNSPELNDLQSRLFTDNLDLTQALYRLDQLEASQKLVAAGRLPSLSLSGSASRDVSPGSNGTSRSTNVRASLAAAYEIDLWDKLKDKESAAALRTQAGEYDVQALLLSLSAQLTDQYFIAVEQQLQLQLLKRQLERNQDLLDTVTDRYKAGLTTTSELYQVRQNQISLQSRRPGFLTTLKQAENNIALLLGQAPGTIQVDRASLPEITQIDGIGIPANLLTRRPDLASASMELEAADHELAAALAEKLPAINLSATLGRSVTRLSSGDVEGTLWSLALGLTQPLFDGGRREAESERQAAIRGEKLAAYQKALLEAIKDVESALSAERNSADRYTLLQQEQQINFDNLQLTEANYLSGLVSSDALLEQEINYLNLRSQSLNQQRQWISQRISLARALGGSWMAEEIEKRREQESNNDENK